MKKKILFVINTFSRAGAEMALLQLLRELDREHKYEISLFVLMGQGELVDQLPPDVRLVNKRYTKTSVLSADGKKQMYGRICRAAVTHGTVFCLAGYLCHALCHMIREKRVQPDKLLWRMLSDGAERLPETYDLAVAYLEGGSAYYVADHVKAKKKAAFIHIDYTQAGYTRQLDRSCYAAFDAVFPIGENVKEQFLKVYPECKKITHIFHNVIDQEQIRQKAEEGNGFSDGYQGIRILTVGRLTPQKAYPVAISAMRRLKDAGVDARWYVLGEGPERGTLTKLIRQEKISDDFILLGAVENPYPYLAQTDLYVHATRFEGKSIAIQEAQTLGCAIVASDCNREQITDGVDGILCTLEPKNIAEAIEKLIADPKLREALGRAAKQRTISYQDDITLLDGLLTD